MPTTSYYSDYSYYCCYYASYAYYCSYYNAYHYSYCYCYSYYNNNFLGSEWTSRYKRASKLSTSIR